MRRLAASDVELPTRAAAVRAAVTNRAISTPRRSRASAIGAIGVCALVAAGLRLPFAFAGLLPDEGGYAFVAQQWGRGATLYEEAWADRPQGLVLAYRLLLAIADEPWAIRLGAVICGVAITILLGVIGWRLRNPATGIAAAGIYAVVGVAPHMTGYVFNGELAAAVPATGAIAAALQWRSTRRTPWLVVAGLAGATAVTVKQSAFDGFLVGTVIVLTASSVCATRRRDLAIFLAATCVPLAASLLHGWRVGWDNYWYAVVGYRLDSSSAHLGIDGLLARPGRMFETLDAAWLDLGPLVLVAAAAFFLARRNTQLLVVPACWLAAALVGFHSGALYWRHYYVQLIPPLALLAAIAATSVTTRRARVMLVGITILPVVVFMLVLAASSAERRDRFIAHRRPFLEDQRLVSQLEARADPVDSIYALVSRAELYFLAGRPSRYPFLWGHPVKDIPGALDRLRSLLASPRRPEWVVVYTPPIEVDPSGGLGRVIRRHYERDFSFSDVGGAVLRDATA